MKEQKKGFLKFTFTRWYFYLVALLTLLDGSPAPLNKIFEFGPGYALGYVGGMILAGMIIPAITYYFYRKKFRTQK